MSPFAAARTSRHEARTKTHYSCESPKEIVLIRFVEVSRRSQQVLTPRPRRRSTGVDNMTGVVAGTTSLLVVGTSSSRPTSILGMCRQLK